MNLILGFYMYLFLCIFTLSISLFSSDIPLEELPFDNIVNDTPPVVLGKHFEQFKKPAHKRIKTNDSNDNQIELVVEEYKEFKHVKESIKLSDDEVEQIYKKSLQKYPLHFKWVEKNASIIYQKIAFLSLLDLEIDDKSLVEIVSNLPKSLVKNHVVVAMSIYLSYFKIPSSMIYDFIMYIRENVETDNSFKALTPQRTYDAYINLDANKLKNPPQSFKGDFSTLIIEYFEPYLIKITGDKFTNQEALTILCDKYQKYETQLSDVNFHIMNPDSMYRELIAQEELKGEESDLIAFIRGLKAETYEKVALLSLFSSCDGINTTILEKIRAAPISLDTCSFIAALCVYLGHFGVQSEHIYSFLMKARPDVEPCRGFTKTTPGTMYKNFCTHFKSDYFKRDFSYSIVEIFEPLSRHYRASDESFMHYDVVLKKHKKYIENKEKKNIVLPRQQRAIDINDTKYTETKEAAYKENPALSQWIDDSEQDSLKKCALFALVTTMVKDRETKKNWVKVIHDANSLSQQLHLIAGIIYLRHFEIEPKYIYDLIAHIRGIKRINKREFSPVTPKGYYEKFVLSKSGAQAHPPKYLKNKIFLNTLENSFIPLLRELTDNPEAEF